MEAELAVAITIGVEVEAEAAESVEADHAVLPKPANEKAAVEVGCTRS